VYRAWASRRHSIFLGCITCSEFSTDSIENKFGPHGSSFSSDSIFNHFSEYGSQFSNYSACNSFASDPPVIVDKDGHYYGRLTINTLHPEIGAGRDKCIQAWLAGVCR
jgi:hypothetical protein